MHRALGDVKVLDFSRVLAGPFATMLLGDLGADILKIERPGAGDESRSWAPPRGPQGEATYFLSVNRNKRSVVLDLTDPGDLGRARAYANAADVVVENFRPSVMERLGLGYEELSGANPRLVYCSICAFGTEAGAGLAGYDLLVQALGGLMSITGERDGEPQKVGVALVDVLAGVFATVGILAALRHRDATGEGQRVQVDLFSALLAALANQGAAYTVAGVVPPRLGNAHPSIAPYEVYSCGEGRVVVAVGNDRQFSALCGAIGQRGLASDPRFTHNPDRVANREELRAVLEEALAGASAETWSERLAAAAVPAGVVNDLRGAFALAERLGLEPVVEVADHAGPPVRLTRNPVRLSKTPASYRLAPPALGSTPAGDWPAPGTPDPPGAPDPSSGLSAVREGKSTPEARPGHGG
ncbi:MAG: CaiB/BaiF CoA transferase family protein [Acidimicrobiales bacterium]